MNGVLTGMGAGFVGTLGLVSCSSSFCMLPAVIAVSSLASTIIGLAVTNACKKDGQTLDTKDLILVGGASIMGSLAGVALVAASILAAITQSHSFLSFLVPIQMQL